MPQVPDPFSLQFGVMTPVGSVTSRNQGEPPRNPGEPPRNEGGPPPLPPRPSLVPPDSFRSSHPERTVPVPNSPSQPAYTSRGTSYGPASQYIPYGQPTASNAEPTGRPNNPFSLRSTLGQFARTAIFGNAGPAPFTPSYASRVTVNGVELGQVDLLSLQTLVGPVSPGTYWYDRRCGGFGFLGGPCRGFIAAGLPLSGGQLAPNASGNTGTRVFINDREIHAMDVLGLQGMGVMVMPGNWWLNADGSYGYEGNPIPLGNLRLQASGGFGRGYGGAGGGEEEEEEEQAVGALVWDTMAAAMDRDSRMLEVLDGAGPADDETVKLYRVSILM